MAVTVTVTSPVPPPLAPAALPLRGGRGRCSGRGVPGAALAPSRCPGASRAEAEAEAAAGGERPRVAVSPAGREGRPGGRGPRRLGILEPRSEGPAGLGRPQACGRARRGARFPRAGAAGAAGAGERSRLLPGPAGPRGPSSELGARPWPGRGAGEGGLSWGRALVGLGHSGLRWSGIETAAGPAQRRGRGSQSRRVGAWPCDPALLCPAGAAGSGRLSD